MTFDVNTRYPKNTKNGKEDGSINDIFKGVGHQGKDIEGNLGESGSRHVE